MLSDLKLDIPVFHLVFHIWNPNITSDATYHGFVAVNLSCALMFEKLRQPLTVDVVSKKEAISWRGTFEQSGDLKWQPFKCACHMLEPLPVHYIP